MEHAGKINAETQPVIVTQVQHLKYFKWCLYFWFFYLYNLKVHVCYWNYVLFSSIVKLGPSWSSPTNGFLERCFSWPYSEVSQLYNKSTSTEWKKTEEKVGVFSFLWHSFSFKLFFFVILFCFVDLEEIHTKCHFC